MKKKSLLYIPLLLLSAFAMSVLVVHYSNLPNRMTLDPPPYRVPFGYFGGVVNLQPEAQQAGIEVGDKIVAFNGEAIENNTEFYRKLGKIDSPDPIVLEIERTASDKSVQTKEVTIAPIMFEKDSRFYLSLLIGFIFNYLLATFCILLGFGCFLFALTIVWRGICFFFCAVWLRFRLKHTPKIL